MVSSPMYDRVMTFAAQADHTEELSAWDSEHRRVLRGFADAIDRVRHFQQHQGFTGQTGDALKAWADKTVARLESKRDYYMRGITHYVAARQAVAQAKADARQLSPTLLDAKTEALRSAATVSLPFAPVLAPVPGLVASAVLATGVAYVNAVEAQANAQREAAAAEILDRINAATGELGGGMGDLTQAGPNDPSGGTKRFIPPLSPSTENNLGRGHVQYSPHDAGVYGRSAADDYGRVPLRSDKSLYPDGYADPDTEEAMRRRALASHQVARRYLPPDATGSYDRPITDPQDLMGVDLMHTRVNANHHRNGYVWGGHVPASPTDIDHPLWRINGGPASDATAAGRLGGAAMLGAGALGLRGAARMGSAGIGAAGASDLRVGSFGGRGFGTYTPPATQAPQGGAGSAHPAMMGGMGAGAGGTKEDKKRRRRKYEPYRYLDEDEGAVPAGYVNPMSQTYGSDKDITPAPRKDDGWDPRQW